MALRIRRRIGDLSVSMLAEAIRIDEITQNATNKFRRNGLG